MTRSRTKTSSYVWAYALGGAAFGSFAACNSDTSGGAVVQIEAGAGGGSGAGGAGMGGSTSAGGSAGTSAGGSVSAGGSAGAAAGAGGTEGGTDGGTDAGLTAVTVTMAKLTADQSTVAPNADPNLVNAWGLAIKPDAPGGPAIWVADNGTGMATVYDRTGKALAVKATIPVPGDAAATSAPTGQVYNDSTAFMGDAFIFATEDGTLAGWKNGNTALLRADRSASGAIYKGIAILDDAGTKRLAATDFHNGKVDLFDDAYAPVASASLFVDTKLPAGYAPFNVAFLGGHVYVTYARQDANKEDDVKGPGLGYVDRFNPDGSGGTRIASAGVLNAPWALAIAPTSLGALSGTLLVGNFGDGKIHAFDATTGAARGTIVDAQGKDLVIDGLWALEPGPKTTSIDLSQTLFFTAGPNDEAHGLLGMIQAVM